MQHVLHALDRTLCRNRIRKIALKELDAMQRFEIVSLAGNQAVDDADAVAATQELFGDVRSDETGTAGDKVRRHRLGWRQFDGKPTFGIPGVIRIAFWK